MIVLQKYLDALNVIVERIGKHMANTECSALLARAVRNLPKMDESADYELPVRRLLSLGHEIEVGHGTSARMAFAAGLVAHLALRLAARLTSMELPDSVLEQYPRTFERLIRQLNEGDLASYWSGDECFLKDIRITGGYSVPCGALDVDLYSTISRKSGLKLIFTQRDLHNGWVVVRHGGPTWFRIHLDPRYLEDFNENGWEGVYRRIADLLLRHPWVKGMVGTTWFFDPKIVEISPRLAYTQTTPLTNGAFLVRHGPAALYTKLATATSPTRRALVEEGSYVPTGYSLIWPKVGLLHWARCEPR